MTNFWQRHWFGLAAVLGILMVGLGTAVFNHRATAQYPTTPTGSSDDLFLPLVTKPGTPPPQIAGCDIFPGDNIWNTPIDTLPVHPNSANYISTIGANTGLHADFGSGVWPARHDASNLTGSNYPPMGLRLRLKASYDISGFPPEIQVILQAFKTYGIILADNGSAWYISGVPDERWNNDNLHEWDIITGSDFEVVDTSSLMIDPDLGQAKQP